MVCTLPFVYLLALLTLTRSTEAIWTNTLWFRSMNIPSNYCTHLCCTILRSTAHMHHALLSDIYMEMRYGVMTRI